MKHVLYCNLLQLKEENNAHPTIAIKVNSSKLKSSRVFIYLYLYRVNLLKINPPQ